ncbi:sialidase-3-like [Anneissia japonica]|uniref:sialidase-3-like n=1 Tax=Anneissia japonica TaxID=1529436 RepID=UPI0014255A07|nr:sialidase-3-like [Anneissia japonica]
MVFVQWHNDPELWGSGAGETLALNQAPLFSKVPLTQHWPGHSIKLESGRLVVTGNIAWPKSVGEKNQPFVIVSDNNGDTWKMGGKIQLPKLNDKSVSGNECQAVEVAPNDVVINCRTPGTYPRIQCYSSDGCDTFGPSEVMQTLTEPKNGCQGSILGISAPLMSDDQKSWALFSNPNSKRLRLNLSVRLSKDSCKTWSDPPIKVLECLGSGYSDLTGFTQDNQQKFACLFERIKITSRNIDLIIFTIDI